MIFFYRIKYDYIKLSGKDRLDLLHRLSTNDIIKLGDFRGKRTILTTDKGRIVDLITLYNFRNFIFSTCSFNNAVAVLNHINKYTIMEDFKADNMAGTHEAILFFGDNANKLFADLFHKELNSLSDNDFILHAVEGKHTIAAKNDDDFGGFVLIYAIEDKGLVENIILKSETLMKYQAAEIDDTKYDELRIEHGIPKLGQEMGEHVNPLECNLGRFVSFTKGCYIGQEVIARLDTYDKVSKHMVGIRSGEKFMNGVPLNELKLTLDDKECGIITSYSKSEKYGYIGLGFVKTTFLHYRKEFKIKNNEPSINCNIVELPFN